jgi:hypothetical protein
VSIHPIPANNMLKGKTIKIVLALSILIFTLKIAADVMGYRVWDLVKNNRDKQTEQAYGVSHK